MKRFQTQFYKLTDWQIYKALAACLFVGLMAVEAAWNYEVGISWTFPSNLDMVFATFALGAVSAYATWRRLALFGELSIFILAFILFPIVGERLSYLAATLNASLVDTTMHNLDAWLGFDWAKWAEIEVNHIRFLGLQRALYESHVEIALGSVLVFAVMRPGTRNYEFLLIYLIGLVLTVFIFAVFPTLGPGGLSGHPRPYEHIILMLRMGHLADLPFAGIVAFPSYHTLMAIAAIYAHRGIKLTFWPMVFWNCAMLFTVPYGGGHYLMDMIGGAAVALVSIVIVHAVMQAGTIGDALKQGVFSGEHVPTAANSVSLGHSSVSQRLRSSVTVSKNEH